MEFQDKELTRDDLVEYLRDFPRYVDLPPVSMMTKQRSSSAGQRRVNWRGRTWEVPFVEYVLVICPEGQLRTPTIRTNRVNVYHTAPGEYDNVGADISGAHLRILQKFRDHTVELPGESERVGYLFVDIGPDMRLEAQLENNRKSRDYSALADKAWERRVRAKERRAFAHESADQGMRQMKQLAELIANIHPREAASGQSKTARQHRAAPPDQG